MIKNGNFSRLSRNLVNGLPFFIAFLSVSSAHSPSMSKAWRSEDQNFTIFNSMTILIWMAPFSPVLVVSGAFFLMTALTRSARSPPDPPFFIYLFCLCSPSLFLPLFSPLFSFFYFIALYRFFALDHCPVVRICIFHWQGIITNYQIKVFITYFKGIDYKTRLPARPITCIVVVLKMKKLGPQIAAPFNPIVITPPKPTKMH